MEQRFAPEKANPMTRLDPGHSQDSPMVSIIVPCRNEEKYISKCLDSVVVSKYSKSKMEVLVVDGMSTDKSRQIVQEYASRHSFVKLLLNPKQVIPAGLNIGVRSAQGSVIILMNAHTVYDEFYVPRCVESLTNSDADNIGGIVIVTPGDGTYVAKAIARSLSHPFGVGPSHYKLSGSQNARQADAVAFGCYRREVLMSLGLFNEDLRRSEDMDLNVRLRRRGGKILLNPNIICYQHARSTLGAFCKHNFANGFWVTYPLRFGSKPFSWRHLVPGGFVFALIVLPTLGLFSKAFLWLVAGALALYAIGSLGSSTWLAAKDRDLRHVGFLPIVFAVLHFSYGAGSVWGLLKVFLEGANRPA